MYKVFSFSNLLKPAQAVKYRNFDSEFDALDYFNDCVTRIGKENIKAGNGLAVADQLGIQPDIKWCLRGKIVANVHLIEI